MTTPAKETLSATNPLLRDYALQSGVADELLDPNGVMRPVWGPFIKQLSQLSQPEITAYFARGDQYLRDAGVFFRQYSTDPHQERDWPLSHIPVILHEREWAEICEGLTQRAELLERVVADLYGDATLVRDGHLPAELVAQNPEWHRPLVGLTPASGHHLHFLAFEIGRSPDGSWLVLGDRTQAPSGAGFALENRMATVRVFPEPFPQSRVQRLAGFFRAFRDAMDDLPSTEGGRTAILTPGPGNDTYFEHTYIARYLGLTLLEGADLLVQDGTVQMRTVSGPKPVSVLWRRLDASYADPLELDETSHLGTPGLVDAVRHSNVNLVNSLGSGILETRALMAFLPQIADVVLGEHLKIPNLATWWCGQAAERDYVKANAEDLFVGEAFSRALPFDIGRTDGPRHDPALQTPEALSTWIDTGAGQLVGQEAVTLSTTPVWDGDRHVPRPMSIRVFAARTAEGWVFLPGGYARIGRGGDATALSMQQGGSVADVWVMRDSAVRQETLFDAKNFRRQGPSVLPSRAADNLFWLGRYIERAEGVIRLLRGYHLRLAEAGYDQDPRLVQIAEQLRLLSLDPDEAVITALNPPLSAARVSAGKVRDRFSIDGWAALADLTNSLKDLTPDLARGDDTARALGILLRKITGFKGLVHENMHRTSGWRFLTLGRAIERADGAAGVLMAFAGDDAGPGFPDVALEYADSVITHQRRYRIDPTNETVTDLLALDASNPRAILFQVTAMRRIAEDLPNARISGRVSPVLRALLPLEAQLSVASPSEMNARRLERVRIRLSEVSDRLTTNYLI